MPNEGWRERLANRGDVMHPHNPKEVGYYNHADVASALARIEELEEEARARKLLCTAYRLGDHRRADKALAMLEKLDTAHTAGR